MNRYRFRLETVLRYRKTIEDNRKRDLAGSLNELRNEQEAYAGIESEINEQDNRAAEVDHGALSARDLMQRSNYARFLDRRKRVQSVRVKNAATVVEGKRSEVAEAMKRRKILDILKEQGRENHEREAAKEEQNMVDDLILQRYNHNGQDQ